MTTEFKSAMQLLSAKFSTAILKYPSGRFGLVGSIPLELTHISPTSLFKARVSNAWNTEQEAIDALLELGYTHFQKADTTWYDTGIKPT